MSFPRYPKYKESGVEWLGEVPEHWHIKGMRNIANVVRGASPRPAGDPRYFGGESVPWVTVAEITKDDHVELLETESYLTDEGANQSKRFAQGTLIYSNSGATLGVPKILRIDACANDGVVAFEGISSDVSPRFLYHFLASITEAIREKVRQGSGQPNLNTDIVKNLQFALPPPAEQQAIESFLYLETSKIDALVGEQRRLIELLKEKRQAVISHAVTKGLNPNAPLKPSGIEWLGDVPEHWEVKPLKYLLSLTSGGTPSKENLAYWDGEVPWASSKDLKVAELFDTQDHITQKALDDSAADLVPPGSILTVVRGMILLHTFPVVVARVRMAINQDLKAILPKPEITGDFLAWLLRGASDEILSRTDEAGHGTKVLRIDTWLAMQVPVPPKVEQSHIVIAIEKRLSELDSLTAEAERGIDLLQERRTALISAAVTGKIDVRSFSKSSMARLEKNHD